MIAVDTNVLVYAHQPTAAQHKRAVAVVIALAEGDVPWAIPVFCLTEFMRVVTHPRAPQPSSLSDALAFLDRLLESPTLRVLNPGPRFWRLFAEAVEEGAAVGNLAFDAQIVAVCREAGVSELMSNDRDFARFRKFSARPLSAA